MLENIVCVSFKFDIMYSIISGYVFAEDDVFNPYTT